MEVVEKEPRDYFEVGVELYLKTCQGNHKATADQEAPSEVPIERIDAYKITLCFGVKVAQVATHSKSVYILILFDLLQASSLGCVVR